MKSKSKKLIEAFEYLKSIGKCHTQVMFAEQIGIHKTNLSAAKNGNEKYLTDGLFEDICKIYPFFNIDYFLKDEGTMLNDKKETTFRLVPIVNLDFVGGMHGNSEITQTDSEYVTGMMPFTDAKEGDICIPVTGDSMAPTCPSGSIILVREVREWREFFGFGNIFCLLLKDGRRILKEVNRSDENHKENILCVSHNVNVPPEELPKKMIDRVWKVIKILTDKGF